MGWVLVKEMLGDTIPSRWSTPSHSLLWNPKITTGLMITSNADHKDSLIFGSRLTPLKSTDSWQHICICRLDDHQVESQESRVTEIDI